MDRLGELRTLAAIIDAGSMAAAAQRLRRSPPSITRDLSDLERRAGTTLIERSTRSCRPTPAGLRLAEQARHLLDAYDDAIGEASGQAAEVGGLLRITAPTVFGRDHVAALVTSFLDKNPAISIDLHLIDRLVDLAEEEYDLAVRIGHLRAGPLIARTVGWVGCVLVASPSYLNAKGVPFKPHDLVGHEIIHHGRRDRHTPWEFRDSNRRVLNVPVEGRLSVNHPDAAVAAALEGRGVVTALSHQVEAHLNSGRLVRLLHDYEPAPLPVNLVWLQSRRPWRRMRLLIDHLATGLGDFAPK